MKPKSAEQLRKEQVQQGKYATELRNIVNRLRAKATKDVRNTPTNTSTTKAKELANQLLKTRVSTNNTASNRQGAYSKSGAPLKLENIPNATTTTTTTKPKLNWTFSSDYSAPPPAIRSNTSTRFYSPSTSSSGNYGSIPPNTPTVQGSARPNQKLIGNNSYNDVEFSDVVDKPALEYSPKNQRNTDTRATPRGGNVGGSRFNMGLAQAMGNMQGDSGKALDNLDKLYDPAVYTKFLNTLDSIDPQTRASLAPYMYKLGLTDEKGFLPSTARGVDEARTRAFNNAYALDPNLSKDQIDYLKSNGEINPATGASTVKNRDYLDTAQVILDYLYGGSPVMQDWLDYDSALRSYNQPSISYADYQNIPNKGTLYDDLEKKVQTERAKNVVSSSDVLRGIPGSLGRVGAGIFDQVQPELVETNPNSNMSLANPMSAPNPSVQLPEATPEPQTPKTYVQNKIKEKVNTPTPASVPVPTPAPTVAPRPTPQEVRARKAQQDEMLRQKMLETAQNPNSSVRANMPSYFNSSTTLQNYYLSNPDLWGRN